MERRALLFIPLAMAGWFTLAYRKERAVPDARLSGSGPAVRLLLFSDRSEREGSIELNKIVKSDAEWQKELTAEEFAVTRKKGTERAFTGRNWNNHEPGMYCCACCGTALFRSEEKYDSGTGWPSFSAPVVQENIQTETDGSLGMERTEVLCSKCDAHLGHVFDDGPAPTNQRCCMNSAALRFVPKAKEESQDGRS